MDPKKLKQLSRSDLLEMLLNLSKENEQLRQELHQVTSKLEDRTITAEKCGSLAEAALNLNGVFQAAQAACDQYRWNVQNQTDGLLAQAQAKLAGVDKRSKEILASANAQAAKIIAQAQMQAKQILDAAEQKLKSREEKYSWITELMESSEEV